MIFVKKTSSQIEMLKYIGALAMLLDHVGVLFYPSVSEFRIIGRFAYPLFGYVLVHNYIFFSTQKLTYIKKLFILAILYEPLHYYLFQNHYAGISIFFMYAMALSFFYIIERSVIAIEKEKFTKEIKIMIFGVFLSFSIFIEYSMIGYLLIMAFYLAFTKNNLLTLGIVIFFTYLLNYPSVKYSLYTLLFLMIVYIISKIDIAVPRSKHFFYLFYPIHIAVLIIIKQIL